MNKLRCPYFLTSPGLHASQIKNATKPFVGVSYYECGFGGRGRGGNVGGGDGGGLGEEAAVKVGGRHEPHVQEARGEGDRLRGDGVVGTGPIGAGRRPTKHRRPLGGGGCGLRWPSAENCPLFN